jgi:hypothetical protein
MTGHGLIFHFHTPFRHLGASALTVIGCLMAARPDLRKSENNTFVECKTLMDKCMPGTPSITKDTICAAVEKHFKIRQDAISCK